MRYAAHVVAYLTLAANPYPRLHRAPRQLPDRRRDRPARAAEPLGDRLPPVPRAPGDPARRHADGLRHERRRRQRRQLRAASRPPSRSWAGSPASFTAACREGFRDLLAYAIGYSAQVNGYLLLLTDRYPNSDPAVYESANVYRSDPIRLHGRRRPAALAADGLLPPAARDPALRVAHCCGGSSAFFAADRELVRDALPRHARRRRCTASSPAYVRYQTHVYAFLQLVGEPVPGLHRQGRAATRSTSRSIRPSARTAGSPASG